MSKEGVSWIRTLWALRTYGRGLPLVGRVLLQRATHLVDAYRYEEAKRLLDECEDQLRDSWGAAGVRLYGRIARGRRKIYEAEIFLETAEEMAEADGDGPEAGLAALERVALFDELGQWGKRREALRGLTSMVMECPEAPGAITCAIVELEGLEDGEPLGSSVLSCLRRRFREWQVRGFTGVELRVM